MRIFEAEFEALAIASSNHTLAVQIFFLWSEGVASGDDMITVQNLPGIVSRIKYRIGIRPFAGGNKDLAWESSALFGAAGAGVGALVGLGGLGWVGVPGADSRIAVGEAKKGNAGVSLLVEILEGVGFSGTQTLEFQRLAVIKESDAPYRYSPFE